MSGAQFPRKCSPTSSRQWIRFACSLAFLAPAPLPAQQDEAVAEALAGILAASDARSYDGPMFRAVMRHADPLVRGQAALAMGRIGQRAAAPLLLEMLSDQDSAVAASAAFSLGLIR